ncbi:restriction endonuclease subunit S [Clostridium thermarum]|uniref:restriction endonuclease subunit S n=1 Tax=Clostridium thermarum TaxID=1716543 RepID=UPI0013D2928C|nr:restriction endonuclease subunit S [Clostridium thermarum]
MKKTPKLRFPEFSGCWEEKRLGELGEFFKGALLSKADLSDEGRPCILYGELYTKYNEVIKEVYSKTNSNANNLILGKKNDVLIPSSGETSIDIATASCLQKDEVILGGDLNVFRPYEVNGVFISYQLNNSKRKEIAKIAQGASVVHIYNEQLKKLKVNISEKREQEKLASFFALIDEKIQKQQKKVEDLEEYKKGIMQKIFSQEIRFKDENGNDFPKWRTVKLEEILEECNEKSTENNQYEVISSTTNGIFYQKDYFNREIASDDNTGYKILKYGQVVLSPQNLWMGNINYNDKFEIGIVSPSYKIFSINTEHNSKFIGYVLRTARAFYEYMQSSEQGASIVRRNLNMELFYEIIFNLPSRKEQDKITEFLTCIESKVSKEEKKLEDLKQLKKGLLQQMFV